MNYPLGSFPRFGYQQRLADERRANGLARAIENSIASRQIAKEAAEEGLAHKTVQQIAGLLQSSNLMVARARSDGSVISFDYDGQKVRFDAVCNINPDFADCFQRALNLPQTQSRFHSDVYHQLARLSIEQLKIAITSRRLVPSRFRADNSAINIHYGGEKIRVSRINTIDSTFQTRLDLAWAECCRGTTSA